MNKKLLFAIFCLFYVLCSNTRAIADDPSKPDTVKKLPAISLQQLLLPDLEPRVVMIRTVHTIGEDSNTAAKEAIEIKKQIAYPGSIIRFTITNPGQFLKSRPTDQSKVVLYVNGLELKGMSTGWYSSVSNQQIALGKVPLFKNTADIDVALTRNDTTKKAWDFLYNNTGRFYNNYIDADISIGWEGMSQLPKNGVAVPLVRIVYYSTRTFFCWVGLFVLVMAGFIILAVYTNALRDGDKECAFSLSLTQLLFWTALVIGAFIYTLVLTDLTSSFNPSVLYMLGISLTTTGVANTIDSRFNKTNPGSALKPHVNFFQDVLTSDGKNYSVQRIQIFAWNLVLGMYFIIYTINNKSMPEFSSTLLFLAGFSSLAYLGAKPPENTAAAQKDTGIVIPPATPVTPVATEPAAAPSTNNTPSTDNTSVAVG